MIGGGEPGHIRAGLDDDRVGDQGADARDRADQVPEPEKGLDRLLDAYGERLDRRGVLVDQAQVGPGQERVVRGEPAGPCCGRSCSPRRSGASTTPGARRSHSDVDDMQVKVAKFAGEFVWHRHADEDEIARFGISPDGTLGVPVTTLRGIVAELRPRRREPAPRARGRRSALGLRRARGAAARRHP